MIIQAGPATIHLDPDAGGRIAQVTLDGVPLLIDDTSRGPVGWGSYPMVPWAGRVGGAKFHFDGADIELDPLDPPHALHGVGFVQPWSVEVVEPTAVELACELDWPLGGRAWQRIEVDPDGLTLTMAVTATHSAMPAVIGWHPWFRRPQHLQVGFEEMFERGPDHLPTGRMVAVAPGPWDDAFLAPTCDPTLLIDGWEIRLSSDCDVWVVYNERPEAVCIEPQSAPPDALRSGSAARLDVGQTLQRWSRWAWTTAGSHPPLP